MFILLAILCSIVALGVVFINRKLNYWQDLGVPQLHPTFPFGDFGPVIRRQQSLPEFYRNVYYRTKHQPIIGLYTFLKPTLLVNDLSLINDVLVNDFLHFHDHGLYVDEDRDPLSGHLFALSGDRWRQIRNKVTPSFTPFKLKQMSEIQFKTAQKLRVYMDRFVKSRQPVEFYDLAVRYTMESTVSILFGCDANCIENPEDDFLRIGKMAVEPSFSNKVRWFLSFMAPDLIKVFRIKQFAADLDRLILDVVHQSVNLRERQRFVRKDVFQSILQLRNSGLVQEGDSWEVDSSNKHKTLTVNQVAAVLFTFFIGGYETSSSLMAFCIYELSRKPEYQQKVQAEIDQVLEQPPVGVLTYDKIITMKYLECCVRETLRLFPPLSFLNRICTKDYQIPNTNITIQKGTNTIVPIFGIQRDPDIYSNPSNFDPERPERLDDDKPFLSYGEGPRQCLGARMGKLQAMIGLATLLAEYDFRLADPADQRRGARLDPKCFLAIPLGGVSVVVNRRTKLSD
ncbi:probable cytochrome P450 6d5 [Uranotaenia lowii]|uniref:probable cytochrome P450 6d5 n=1 Tax=Uranotaenia lowii TaxID=190385 RepID=UPI00247988EF|nr:probable cytochrome P450 6d5 [Uranotaenia lowii]